MDIVVPADAAAGYAFLTVTLLAGELVRDANNRTPIFGRTGEIYAYKEFEYPDGVVVTLTTRIEPRRAMVEASEDNLVAVLSLPAGGATALFVRDEEVFYDLRAKDRKSHDGNLRRRSQCAVGAASHSGDAVACHGYDCARAGRRDGFDAGRGGDCDMAFFRRGGDILGAAGLQL